MSHPEQTNRMWGERTTADLSSLLVELGRMLRGIAFYGEGAHARVELLGRTFMALRVELERAGPLELSIDEKHFRASGIDEPIAHGHVGDLARALTSHGVERVAFDEELTRDALAAFVELLDQSPRTLERAGGLARSLVARSSAGIRINGGVEQPIHREQRLIDTPAVATASLDSTLLAAGRDPVTDGGEDDDEKPTLDERPLEARASDERGERLLFRLIELDRCTDDAAYEFLAGRIVQWATELFDDGLTDECHRAILVLADHAVGKGGRSGLQARIAHKYCLELASKERLGALVDRARASHAQTSLRATQVLLLLGEKAIPTIFDRLLDEQDEESSAQLTAVLIVLTEAALAHVRRMILGPSSSRALLAVRLAAELQNQEIVDALAQVLLGPQAELRREAARSLAHLGGEAATDALVDALSSDLEDMAEIVAHYLGARGDRRAAPALLGVLEHAVQQGDAHTSREMIRALGQLGHECAVPKLVALLERRMLLRRKWLAGLQIAAIAALGQLPGREAHRAVERAVGHRETAVRELARQILAARGHAEGVE